MADRLAETTGGNACPMPPNAAQVGGWYISGGFTSPYIRTVTGDLAALGGELRIVPTLMQASDGTTRSVSAVVQTRQYDGDWRDYFEALDATEVRTLSRQLDAMADLLDSWAGVR
ncbi:hypothetical protein [Mycobacterium sp. 96-892]|uniref:hypothetical protein n=1 Tax=Mycobacterium sp. 96-892 TaxID=1855664 RepID=UPI00099204B6|nr:hypothetical protein [Mycobacterium sp. 96-892]